MFCVWHNDLQWSTLYIAYKFVFLWIFLEKEVHCFHQTRKEECDSEKVKKHCSSPSTSPFSSTSESLYRLSRCIWDSQVDWNPDIRLPRGVPLPCAPQGRSGAVWRLCVLRLSLFLQTRFCWSLRSLFANRMFSLTRFYIICRTVITSTIRLLFSFILLNCQ